MSAAASKGCVVAYAGTREQYLWALTLDSNARISDALAAARAAAGSAPAAAEVPWDTALVGIFGEPRRRTDGYADGDRIELYRPLARDPRERRREQVALARRAAGPRG